MVPLTNMKHAWLAGATAVVLVMASVAGSGAGQQAIGGDPLQAGGPALAQIEELKRVLADLQRSCALDPSACQTGADFFGLDDIIMIIIIIIVVIDLYCEENPEECEGDGGGYIAGGGGPVGGVDVALPAQHFAVPVGRALAPDILCAYWFGPPCDDLALATQVGAAPSRACGRPAEVLGVSGPGGQGIYLEDRAAAPGEVNHWVYVESNGIPGLQRGGESLLGEGDPCADNGEPDTLVF